MTARLSSYAVEVADEETTPYKFEIVMADATDEVMMYCQKRATFEQLAANRWARGKATVLACYYFSCFAGEVPNAGLDAEREKIMDQLQNVFEMKTDIPGITYSGEENQDACPVVSNLAVDLTRLPAIRTVAPASTGMRRGIPAYRDLPTSYPRRPYG